jgi:hypothetical protein
VTKGASMPEKTKTVAVTDIRPTTPMLFGGLWCGMGGHVYRVVVASNQPTALECTRCMVTWKTDRIESAGEVAP